jgi:hypothetical protein
MSGDHTSAHSFTAAGISNFTSLPEQKKKNNQFHECHQNAGINDNSTFHNHN